MVLLKLPLLGPPLWWLCCVFFVSCFSLPLYPLCFMVYRCASPCLVLRPSAAGVGERTWRSELQETPWEQRCLGEVGWLRLMANEPKWAQLPKHVLGEHLLLLGLFISFCWVSPTFRHHDSVVLFDPYIFLQLRLHLRVLVQGGQTQLHGINAFWKAKECQEVQGKFKWISFTVDVLNPQNYSRDSLSLLMSVVFMCALCVFSDSFWFASFHCGPTLPALWRVRMLTILGRADAVWVGGFLWRSVRVVRPQRPGCWSLAPSQVGRLWDAQTRLVKEQVF